MDIVSAVFVTSLAEYGPFANRGLKQIAIAGRSNVGKSTLINSLCRLRNLAKVSSTPGKTRLINIFLLNDSFHLVDLPGYGYAKVDKAEKQRWGGMMQRYFDHNEHLQGVIHLVDIRHEPSPEDVEMNAFLRANGIPFITVATKADKLSRAARQRALIPICRALAVQPWDIIPYSSMDSEGRPALLAAMDTLLSAAPVASQ